MTEADNQDPKIQADHNSIAIGGIQIGGNVGDIRIGHSIGFTSEQVSTLITQISSTFQPKPFDGRCPYKGLDVFEEEDAELFFGRDNLIEDLVSRVKESRTVFVTGPSGSGKSSLVRAGLIHALKQGAVKELHSEHWLYATMKPGRDPIGKLARVTASLASSTNAEDEVHAKAMTDATIFARWCEIALKEGRDRRVVLFIDQFEEVFTQISKDAERIAFLNLLIHAATVENGRVIILFSMRSDFVSNCATYPQLNTLLNRQFVQIGAMQPDELVSAIAQPALRVGLRIDPDLIAQIINDMKGEPGVLPLMQFALKDLFDSVQANTGLIVLTLYDYLTRGGIHKALERHADASFSRLDTHEQELARSIFSRLIEIGRGTQDTCRTAFFHELIRVNMSVEAVKVIVRKLADSRLITTAEQSGKDTVTISHEKLIDAWPWLRKLVNENRDVIALQNAITSDAKEWEEHRRDPSYLYRGARLATAQEKFKKLALSGRAQIFLNNSIKTDNLARQQSQRLQRRLMVELMIFLGVITILLIFSSTQIKISHAQLLGSQAQVSFLGQNYNFALLLAYQSKLIHQNDYADLVLSELLYTNFAEGSKELKIEEPARILKGLSDSVTSVTWSPHGQQLASVSRDNTVIVWDFKAEQPTQILQDRSHLISSVAWSPNGQLLAGASGSTNTITIFDLETGQPLKPLNDRSSGTTSVAWSPDGQQLASGSFEGIITIWDVKTGQSTQILDEHVLPGRRSQSVLCLAWSSDGRLAAGLADQRIIVWDLKTGASPQILSGHTNPVHSIAWSDDGQLASSSIVAFIWDLNRGKPALTLNGLTVITSVAWSPDGRLASSTDDGAIILWNLKTGQSAQTIKAHTGPINSISWSSLGQLASGSDDGIIKITRGDLTGVDPCNKIIRNLTIQEWREYVGYLSIYQPACPNLYDPTLSQRHARSYFLVVMLLFVLAASLRVLFNFTWPSRDSMQSRKS